MGYLFGCIVDKIIVLLNFIAFIELSVLS